MNKSKTILIFGAAGVFFGSVLLCRCISLDPPAQSFILTTDILRRDFIAECSLSATELPPTYQEIILPEDGSSEVYESYLLLQDKQRLPLSEYAGQKAVIWTYTLSDNPAYRAELICTPEGLLLGAMCYDCTRFDLMYPMIT
ncbi:MAG: DUF4830 domain-containing protein [Ruminococcus sp.]|nr:DUF4830 domain-containing protein [Ruminococcus sp.]